jgi:xylulokinase
VFLGLDIGTQSLKAALVDEKLNIAGLGAEPLTYSSMAGNRVEQEAGDWIGSLRPAIAKALDGAGCGPDDIMGIGVGGQLDGCVPVDRHGDPLHPALIWMDRRAVAVTRDISPEVITRRCGLVLDPSHMGAKIAWFAREKPGLHQQTVTYHQPVTFLVEKLTGNRRMDHALASTTMLYDVKTEEFAPDLCNIFHASEKLLPDLANMHEPAGELTESGAELTGLPRGIPVAVGTGDDFTNAIGAGLLQPGSLFCQIGTAEVVGTLSAKPAIDKRSMVETHRFIGGMYFIQNPGLFSGGAVEWIVRILNLAGVEMLNKLAADAPPGSDGVLFLPALTGAMAPEWLPDMRGCFYGLSAAHDARHLARAVLEGTAFAMHDVQNRLTELGLSFDRVVLAGGGAASSLWAQIRADISELPVDVSHIVDASPLGAAALGAVACRAFDSVSEMAPLLEPAYRRFEPNPANAGVYKQAYHAYASLFSALKPLST